jgi:hypothetical protein
MNHKLSDQERERLEEAFRFGEAEVRLEGLEPSPIYSAIKARVIAGELTWKEGEAEILAHYRRKGWDEVFAALDTAKLPENFMSDADRDRRPPEFRPKLDELLDR